MLEALKPYGDLVSVLGALLLFFSWITTNLVAEKFKSAKAAYEAAAEKRVIRQMLTELKGDVESVAAEAINARLSLVELELRSDPQSSDLERREWYGHRNLILRLASTGLNARQIDYGNNFCNLTIEHSLVGEEQSTAQAKLGEACSDISRLKSMKDQLIERMEINLQSYNTENTALKIIEDRHSALRGEYRSLLEPFPSMLKKAVDASNEREDELREELERASGSNAAAKRVAVLLYVSGSVMVLSGQVLSKLV